MGLIGSSCTALPRRPPPRPGVRRARLPTRVRRPRGNMRRTAPARQPLPVARGSVGSAEGEGVYRNRESIMILLIMSSARETSQFFRGAQTEVNAVRIRTGLFGHS